MRIRLKDGILNKTINSCINKAGSKRKLSDIKYF